MSPERIPAAPGTYVLILRAPDKGRARVGKLGTLDFRGGWLAYVGSALGPGGLKARVGRHLARGGTCHWHIDYLRSHAEVVEVWYAVGEEKREEEWAEALRTSVGAETPLAGFGSSDCGCPGHLVRFRSRPDLNDHRSSLESPQDGPVQTERPG